MSRIKRRGNEKVSESKSEKKKIIQKTIRI